MSDVSQTDYQHNCLLVERCCDEGYKLVETTPDAGKFQTAIVRDDAATIAELIEVGKFSPDTVNDVVHTPTVLYCAVMNGSLAVVKTLVEHGANIDDGCPCNRYTPLALAKEKGLTEIVQYLISKNASLCYRQTRRGRLM